MARFGFFGSGEEAYQALKSIAIRSSARGARYLQMRIGSSARGSDRHWRIYFHRLVMAYELGRVLHSDEHVHHRDGNTRHNHPDNLLLCSREEHHAEHGFSGLWFSHPHNEWRFNVAGKRGSLARLVMEVALGRRLRRNEVVVRRNKGPAEFRPEDLEVITRKEMFRRNVAQWNRRGAGRNKERG